MGRMLSRGGALASALVIGAMLAGGGAYALSSGAGKKITVCVHHSGHGLYTGRCAKHDQKLSWNLTGPAGLPGKAGAAGPQGPQGPQGATGVQGPGATLLTYDASASATPTFQSIGTALGMTLTAECSIPPSPAPAGEAQLTVEFTTPDGSLTADLSDVEQTRSGTSAGTAISSSARAVLPVGYASTPQSFDQVTAQPSSSTATSQSDDDQGEVIMLAPVKGYMVVHANAATAYSPASQTCHFSAESFPAASGTSVASGRVATRAPASGVRLHRPLFGR